MKNNNNKRNIIIASVVGVMMIISVGCANSVATSEQVNIDDVTSEVAEAATGDTLEAKTENNSEVASDVASSVVSDVEAKHSEDESTIETSTVTTSAYGTPQEYNGDPEGRGPGRIIVKGFDYNDVYQGMAWKGDYWTASNGVEIKVIPVEGNIYERLPVPDGKGLDNAPGSPFRVACNEAAGTASDKFNAVSETIPVTSFKRSSIDTSDGSLLAFKNSYDSHYGGYSGGGAANASLNVFSDGVADVDNLGATFWSIRREGDYWKLQINGNLDAWRWSGVHQILRYLDPNGDSLYQLFYDDFYTGRQDIMPTYDDWYSYGSNQVLIVDTPEGYVAYNFK